MRQMCESEILISPDYARFLAGLKARIQSARISAARLLSRELILLYCDIGAGIVDKPEMLGWGESVIEQVSVDLQSTFPGSTGYSPPQSAQHPSVVSDL